MQNGTVTLEGNLGVPYKTTYNLTIRSSDQAPWYLPKGVENMSAQKPACGCL